MSLSPPDARRGRHLDPRTSCHHLSSYAMGLGVVAGQHMDAADVLVRAHGAGSREADVDDVVELLA